jgi:uncharacterized protein YjiS (DUF1127 family)
MLINFIHFLRSWSRASNTLQQLASLTDRELADIGLRREDIPRVAWDRSN